MKNVFVILVMILSAFYLINPTFGIFELIPDNMPLVGNLDEAGAMLLLLSGFRYFNMDVARLFEKRQP